MLDASLKTQLQAYLERLTRPVHLVASLDDGASSAEMLALLTRARAVLPSERLWVNPDCGLKTRSWPEVEAALTAMVEAARRARAGQGRAE